MSSPAAGSTRRRAVAIAATAVVALAFAVVAYDRWGSPDRPAASPTAKPSATPTKAPTTAAIYATLAPSVVAIEGLGADGKTANDLGTGVVVNGDGTILTALHVVKGAHTIRVTFADGTVSAAIVAATSPASDIATLTPATLPSIVVPAVLGRADRLAVGDGVIAIGNPLGLIRSTTVGVVSGLNRAAPRSDGPTLSGLIQFDAAVNPGSSGGPLVNSKGETVGIVVALANPSGAGTFAGIGFAVPIATAVTAGGGGRQPQQ